MNYYPRTAWSANAVARTRYQPVQTQSAGLMADGLKRRNLLAWFGAIWLVIQIFDTVINVGGSQEAANTVFLYWILIPVFLYERGSFLQKGLHGITKDSAFLTVSLVGFFGAGACSAFLSDAPSRSLGFLGAAAAAFLIYSDLSCVLGSDFLLLLERYAIGGGIAIGITFGYWIQTDSGARMSLGPHDHPNHFGLICFTVVGAGLACRSRFLKVIISGGALFILCVAQSRTNFIGGLVAVLAYSLYSLRWKRTVVAIMLLLIALVAIGNVRTDLTEHLSSVLLLDDPYRGINSGFSGRSDHLPVAMDLFLASPALGHGFRIEELYLPQAMRSIGAIHNGYLGALVEVGLLGATPLFLIIAVGTYRLHREAKRSRLHMVGFSLVVGYLTIALAQPYLVNLANPAGTLAWALLLGVFARRPYADAPARQTTPQGMMRNDWTGSEPVIRRPRISRARIYRPGLTF